MGEGAAGGVYHYVHDGGAAAGDEYLMRFVGRAVSGSESQCQQGPLERPAGARAAHGAKQQHTEDKVFGDVGAFANCVMNVFQGVGASEWK